jgi:hypothetical protein
MMSDGVKPVAMIFAAPHWSLMPLTLGQAFTTPLALMMMSSARPSPLRSVHIAFIADGRGVAHDAEET